MGDAMIMDVPQSEYFFWNLHLAAKVLGDMSDAIARYVQFFYVDIPV